MARRSEKGSIVGYVLVGAVLTALLVGGVYVVKHNVASESNEVATVKDSLTESSTEPDPNKNSSNNSKSGSVEDALNKQAEKNKAESGNSNNTNDSGNNTAVEENKAATNNSSASTNNSGSVSGNSNSGSTNPLPQTATAPTSTTSSLPKTGPGEAVITAFATVTLLGVGFAYIRSQRLI